MTFDQDGKILGPEPDLSEAVVGTYSVSKMQSSGLLPVCADSEKLSGLKISPALFL